jgi:hypothetical protein
MSKLVKFAIVGGVVGGAAAYFQGGGDSIDGDSPAAKVAPGVAGGIAAGATVGFVLDRRGRKKAKKRAARTVALVDYGRKAKPAVDGAVARARDAAEVARPHVEQAASVALERAADFAEAARPVVAHAAEVAKEQVQAARHLVAEHR